MKLRLKIIGEEIRILQERPQLKLLFTGGTVAAMRAVCASQNVVACHLAGGTHHAFRGIYFIVIAILSVFL